MQEVGNALPFLGESFSRIFSLNERIKTISKDMQELMDIWGEQILERDNPDNKFYFEKLREREDSLQQMQKTIDEIHKTGCIIKDINAGLVDFYCRRGEDLIFLCWKYGEDRISYWHTIDGGFGRRRPIEELLQLSERSV